MYEKKDTKFTLINDVSSVSSVASVTEVRDRCQVDLSELSPFT